MTQRRTARIAAVAVGLVVVALLGVLVAVEPGDSESASSPLLGRAAPVVKSTTIDGDSFELSRRKGSWVVLNFFNSTCVPCKQEHPELLAFAAAQQTASTPVEIYTVINDDNDAAVRDFFDKNGGDWPKVRDEDGAISVAFGVAKVPETWVIDPNGFVRLRVIGALTPGFLDSQIRTLESQYRGEQ